VSRSVAASSMQQHTRRRFEAKTRVEVLCGDRMNTVGAFSARGRRLCLVVVTVFDCGTVKLQLGAVYARGQCVHMQTSSILRVGAFVCVRVFICEEHK